MSEMQKKEGQVVLSIEMENKIFLLLNDNDYQYRRNDFVIN
jgi:hypothetical protein